MITELKITKSMGHNYDESSRYHVQNTESVIDAFLRIQGAKNKRISAVVMAKDICLIRQNELDNIPKIVNETSGVLDPGVKEECFSMASGLYEGIVKRLIEERDLQLEHMLEAPGSKMEAKQEKFNYIRVIKKKMQTNTKVFKDLRMEGYDFREIDLEGALFINCSLKMANFSHVNLENTIFVNCDLTKCLLYKSQMNGALVINGKQQELVTLKRSMIQNE